MAQAEAARTGWKPGVMRACCVLKAVSVSSTAAADVAAVKEQDLTGWPSWVKLGKVEEEPRSVQAQRPGSPRER